MSTRKSFSRLLVAATLSGCSAFFALPASAADFPAGTYTTSGVTLAFDGNGHFRGTEKDALKVEGDYAASGDRLKFTDKNGEWACPAEQAGTYRWKADRGMLTFSKVNDSCKDRVESLTRHPWKKQG